MNIKRMIDQNYKSIFKVALIVVFIIFIIRLLNYYSEEKAKKDKILLYEKIAEQEREDRGEFTEEDFNVESDSVTKAMRSFVKYCNEKKIDQAYLMLTDDCKEVLYPTIEDFQEKYVNIVYNSKRDYEIKEWSTSRSEVYLVTLYEDMLATGGLGDIRYEYYTFIKDKNGNYKLNVNNFISRENKNKSITQDGIKVTISQVDVYAKYQEVEITINNETDKRVKLTGNIFENIFLQNSEDAKYNSLNSEFDLEEIVLEPNETRDFKVTFNKYYDLSNPVKHLVLPNIIMDYDEYLKCEDKQNYNNRQTIKILY